MGSTSMDVCVATNSVEDINCLGVLLRSLETFADLRSCNLIVSHNSPKVHLRKMVEGACRARQPASLTLDFFDPVETVDSNQHGEALNRLFGLTESKYVIVADPDVMVTSSDWLDFHRGRIDAGDFMVGTPYCNQKVMWQDSFPNVWCAMLDGDELRSARLDMRTEYIKLNGGSSRWTLLPDSQGKYRDTGWRLADHAASRKLGNTSLTLAGGTLPGLLEKASKSMPAGKERGAIAQAGRVLRTLRAREFTFPGTDKVCCAHMQGAAGRPGRANRWRTSGFALLDVLTNTP